MQTILTDGLLDVTVNPLRGGSVDSIIDSSGISYLWSIPEIVHRRLREDWEALAPTERQQAKWIHPSAGGWEVMSPNAGPGAMVDGVSRGFHGEAGLVEWEVLSQQSRGVELRAADPHGLFDFGRRIQVGGSTVSVIESLRSKDSPVRAVLGSHLAFGGSFVDQSSHLELRHNGKFVYGLGDFTDVNESSRISRGSSGIYYAAFDTNAQVTMLSPAIGRRVTVTWDAAEAPFCWIWVERTATLGWPWRGSVEAVGIEPTTSIPDVQRPHDPIPIGSRLRMSPRTSLRLAVSVAVSEA